MFGYGLAEPTFSASSQVEGTKPMKLTRKLTMLLAALLSLSLLAAACGGDDESVSDDEPATTSEDAGTTSEGGESAETDADYIVVDAGEQIEIRSLNAITGDVAFLGIPNQRAVEAAVADYGDIEGFSVTSGEGLDDLCSAEGGQAAAQQIVADEQIVGVIGTSCSGAATAAAPLISEAGIVMISGSNTSPALTSDLQGNAGESYKAGYYRTAHNDLYQGAAMAEFVYNDLGLMTAAAIHDGDPYTQGLAQAFADAFEALGGTITGFTGVNKEDTDMTPVLTEVGVDSPEALFFPIFQPAGDFIADQASGVAGLENTQLLAADGLLVDGFMELSQSEGIFFSGPDTRFGQNTNQSTGKTAEEVLADYEATHGEAPSAAFWGHSYDATTILLDAIAASSTVNGAGQLVIDKAGVRAFITALRDYSGLIGTINCDDFGDCGSQKITVIHHESASDIEASKANVVFEYAP
jgi:branched-chain amino acid transport system substrate-binding protein